MKSRRTQMEAHEAADLLPDLIDPHDSDLFPLGAEEISHVLGSLRHNVFAILRGKYPLDQFGRKQSSLQTVQCLPGSDESLRTALRSGAAPHCKKESKNKQRADQ